MGNREENSEKEKKLKKNQPEIPRPPGLLFTSTIQMVLNSPLLDPDSLAHPACP